MHTFTRYSALVALMGTSFSNASAADTATADNPQTFHVHEALEEVLVSANPLSRSSGDLSQSATVLQGAALQQQLASSIGETLARTPGLSNASFGENVGRPVIRGLQGTRVGTLNNSMAVSDASSVSQDHAVSVEPFLADQIEVLRGPSSLLFGSGAIGGVVNMVSPSIPQVIPEQVYSGRFTTQGNNAANEKFAAGRLDLGKGDFALHLDGFHRRTDDYDIPGRAELYPEEENDHEEEDHGDDHNGNEDGTLENSFLKNHGATIGVSWIGEEWRFGAAYNEYKSDYGIPGGAHEHGHDDHDDEHGDEEHDDEHHGEEEVDVTIRLRTERTEAELVGSNPFYGFEQLKVRFVDTSYKHLEYVGDEIGTVFRSDSDNTRVELKHNPWGAWQGVFGLQYTDLDFSAEGAEAFVPESHTKTSAVFWIEHAELDAWQVDLGLRYEDVSIEVPITLIAEEGATGPSSDSDFQPVSASAGLIWSASDMVDLTGSVSYAERAPGVDELYANGPHIATQVFEVGDASLDKESTVHIEGGARVAYGRFTSSATVYWDQFDNYIYQQDSGLEEDGFPVRFWLQQGADFVGAEVELRYDFEPNRFGHWQVFSFGDIVDGELDDNTDAPQQPPKRVAFGVDWDLYNWAANVVWIHAYDQDNVAPLETRTPGYDLLNAEVIFTGPSVSQIDWQVYLKGQNLLDEDIRNSTSYLKDQAPQIGLNVVFGVRAYF
ncbi:putative TonB-dependent receptor [Halioglobus japonicus]|nr:putative TonB-dependent receptor [Halioglobus japonicus]